MRKTVIYSCLAGSALIILASFNAAHVLALFLITGSVPGIPGSIPPALMLLACSFFGILLLMHFVVLPLTNRFMLSRRGR